MFIPNPTRTKLHPCLDTKPSLSSSTIRVLTALSTASPAPSSIFALAAAPSNTRTRLRRETGLGETRDTDRLTRKTLLFRALLEMESFNLKQKAIIKISPTRSKRETGLSERKESEGLNISLNIFKFFALFQLKSEDENILKLLNNIHLLNDFLL